MAVRTKTKPFAAENKEDSRITAVLLSGLKEQITSGAIAPGAKFPPERELAKIFKVNRASMRQALKVLEMMGVLTQRVGDGTYLSNSAETILTEPLNFLVLLDGLSAEHLMETRLLAEPELAARAAERATSEDLAALRAGIAALEKSSSQRERFTAELEFHDALLRAGGNRIFRLLFRDIYRILRTELSGPSSPLNKDASLSFHRRIYAAIKLHDSEAARSVMREHLVELSQQLRGEATTK